MAKEIKLPSISDIKSRLDQKLIKIRPIHPEINLVPDIKGEMIKALKLRNFIFFLCIVISSASFATGLIFLSIAGGQQASVDGKKATIDELSSTLNSFSDLSEYLTIRDQLGNLASITSNKKLLSRSFSILSAIIPTGADTITISELSINLSGDNPTFSFDAQANAGSAPYIDYNVLDSFKKSMQYMRYDYGNYVDKEGAEIPAYCMIENGTNGATFSDPDKGYYAYWLILGEGCNPSYVEPEEDETSDDSDSSTGSTADSTTTTAPNDSSFTPSTDATTNSVATTLDPRTEGYTTEEYNGQTVVRIWRTPQFNDWYKETPRDGEPQMDLSGTITNVAHFESSCTSYTGYEAENGTITWETANDTCLLVPDGTDGIRITDSSNGRGAGDELVLRFSATISFNPEAYNFNNHHVMAVAPSGRYNVTDSYVQIQNIFGERAADCAEGDTTCNNTSTGGN